MSLETKLSAALKELAAPTDKELAAMAKKLLPSGAKPMGDLWTWHKRGGQAGGKTLQAVEKKALGLGFKRVGTQYSDNQEFQNSEYVLRTSAHYASHASANTFSATLQLK